ncbi:Small glutamine-rich tetratricopeptide repeat-containing protein alpha [Gracilariopsis chorda]|uniref:Small glutamine-rich tetratricopeptide repeat-containing protein alpha n=1 Tax=Gracilariopsis chorda TaxID=448386 RepID=A0A2V3J8T1_9FLOR|nr:Small glutamine-rich tetratricopeptide repeat-containing protein alpha [Gracilariopsis chorda]|eukprot:PXF49440.1 Small glutamine-rich tetratricopeptide repeat-containing protein alpha [Gracilariopsis chorda]
MEDERWLMMAVLEHLQKASRTEGMNKECIEEAMFAISNAYSLNMRNSATRQRYPLNKLSLVDVFKAGRETLLRAARSADATCHSAVAAANGGAENGRGAVKTREGVDEGFERFIKRLKDSTSLFEGVEEGGAEYERRVQRAREKYESKRDAKRDAKRRKGSCQTASGKSEAENKAQAEALKSEGNSKLKDKQYEEALQLYGRSIALDGSNAVYYSNRAAAYMLLHRFEEAVDDCKKAIELDGAFMRPRERLAQAYRQMGRTADEVDALTEALNVHADNEKLEKMMREAKGRLEEERDTGPSLQEMAARMGDGNFEEMISSLGRDGVSNMANMLGLDIAGDALDEVFEQGALQDMQNMIRQNPHMVQQAVESMMNRGFNVPWMGGGGAGGGEVGGRQVEEAEGERRLYEL